MIREIRAKTLLARVKGLDTQFGLDYGMNLYRGCEHRCIYCDSRSRCYEIDAFDRDILVKRNAIECLEDELPRKRHKGIVGTGSMCDPYMPLEATEELTRRALISLARHGFGVHVITKSTLVTRDIPLLQRIARQSRAVVSWSITTVDDDLARRIEPGAPPSSERFRALRTLADAGIETRVSMMPVLPFIEDTWDNVSAIVRQAHAAGATAILPWFGMSLRDRQRTHYYAALDQLFWGLRERYEMTFDQAYLCASPHARSLHNQFVGLCNQLHIATSVEPLLTPSGVQLALFEGGTR